MRRDRRGLTLVELLAVMMILAALAAVLYPAVATQIRKAGNGAGRSITNLREPSQYQRT